ncbi:MAG: hypothetical protein ACI4DW_04670, partial [Lachnospiraceae bacterium]
GSYRKVKGSYQILRGSGQRVSAGWTGSYSRSSFRGLFGSYLGITGSYRRNNNNNNGGIGSYRRGSYHSLLGSYLGWTGSYSRSSFRSLFGSYLGITGSFRGMNGSFRGITGSGHRRNGSYYGISDAHKDFLNMAENEITIYEEGNEVPDIGALGYGLDLI